MVLLATHWIQIRPMGAGHVVAMLRECTVDCNGCMCAHLLVTGGQNEMAHELHVIYCRGANLVTWPV